MNNQILVRAGKNSIISGVVAAIIYVIIALATGAKLDGGTISVGLLIGGITLVIAFVLSVVFTLIFSRRRV